MNPEGMCACAFAVLAVAAEQLAARVDARTQFTTRRVTEIFQKATKRSATFRRLVVRRLARDRELRQRASGTDRRSRSGD